MKGKLKDNYKLEGKLKRLKSKLVRRIGKSVGPTSRTKRTILQKIRRGAGWQLQKNIRFFVKGLAGLDKVDHSDLGGAKIFKECRGRKRTLCSVQWWGCTWVEWKWEEFIVFTLHRVCGRKVGAGVTLIFPFGVSLLDISLIWLLFWLQENVPDRDPYIGVAR